MTAGQPNNVRQFHPRGSMNRNEVRDVDVARQAACNAGCVVLACERDLFDRGLFQKLAHRIRPKAFFDLRPAASMRFIDETRAGAFWLFDKLKIEYVDVATCVGGAKFDDGYWTSDRLKNTLSTWIDRLYCPDETSLCLFGTHEQMREGRPTVLSAFEQSQYFRTRPNFALYRSGLLAV